MTQPREEFDSLLLGGGGPPAAKFPTVGTVVEGTLTGKDTQHKTQYNPNPNAEKVFEYFKSGDPKKELILTLQTDQRDPARENDNGVRRVFVPFQMQQALAKAVNEAGIKGSLPLGSRIRIQFTHEVPSQGGGNPRKEYAVQVSGPADQILKATVVPASDSVQVTASTPSAKQYSPEVLELFRQQGIDPATLPA